MSRIHDSISHRLLILLISLVGWSHAATYYFDSFNGSDSYSATQAQDMATPWKTLDKLETAKWNMKIGDVVRFKRGGRFFGGLTFYNSGTPSVPFVYADYGAASDPLPVITGAAPLSDWTNEGNGIWSTEVNYTLVSAIGRSSPFQLFINDERMTLARTPNEGWYRMTGGGGNNFQDSSRNEGGGYFNGATIRARGSNFQWGNAKVTNFNGGDFQLDSSLNGGAGKGYGYYIENRREFLDSPGEWWWDETSNRIYLMTPKQDDPSQYFVDVTVVIQGFEFIGSASWHTFQNLQFEKNIDFNIRMDSGGPSGIVADGCRFLYSNIHYGSNGGTNNVVQNSYFYESYQNAIVLGPGTALNNTVLNNGMLPGYGPGSYAISVNYHTSGSIIQNNRVDNCGYVGIDYDGTNNKIIGNYLTNVMKLLSDGGGIYSYGGVPSTDSIVQDNIVMYAYGGNESLPEGVAATATCIYCDDNLLRITVQGNTMAHCGYGLFIHNDQNVKAIDNTIFDCGTLIYMQNNAYSFANNIIQDNLLATGDFGQLMIKEPWNPSGPNALTYTGNSACDPYAEGVIEGRWNNMYSVSQYQETLFPGSFPYQCKFRLPYYQVKEYLGDNLVPNGNFSEHSTEGWNSYPGGKFEWIAAGNEGCSSNCLKYSWPYNSQNSGGAYINIPIPTLTMGTAYELKFTAHATFSHVFEAFVRNTGAPYRIMTQVINDGYELTEVEYNYVFWVNEQSPEPVSLEWSGDVGTVPNSLYLSNIELRPVTYFNQTQNEIFINPTQQQAKITLPAGTWINVQGEEVENSIVLPSMGSAVLYQKPSEDY